MKRNILILFAVVSLLISLTGCGGSGSSNSVAPVSTAMTSVRVSLTQNGQAVTGAEAALYTPDAAMREGLTQAQNNANSRASIGNNTSEGVYKPTSTSADGTYTFTVPTGEYTLIANKGDSKAVITNLRAAALAEEQEDAELKYELTPTGTINGKVISNVTGISVAGVIVYLNGTSFVAITNSDGSFSMTGVPQDTFNISALSNQNGKTYAATLKQVVMPSELVKNDVEVVLAEAASAKTYKITGSITGNDKANKVIMASNGSNIFVGTSSEDGSFNISVTTKGQYSVTCFGADKPIQTIDVKNDTNSLSDSFIVNKFSEGYGAVKGNIEYDQQYLNYIDDNDLTAPDVDKYLVRLIGVDGTAYSTQTKSNYNYSEPSAFMFDNVYPGTYTIFVDPAGNGFVGSIGTFTVKAGEILDLSQTTATATVKFVKPVFTAIVQEDTDIQDDYPVYQIIIKEKYPFLDTSDNNKEDGFLKNPIAYCRVIGDNGTPRDAYLKPIPDENEYLLSYKDDPALSNPLTKNGKYEIVLHFNWADSNTGLKGTLLETQVVNYTGDLESIGDVKIERIEFKPATSESYEMYKVNYYDGYVSGFYNEEMSKYFWEDVNSNPHSSFFENCELEDVYAVSGNSLLYTEDYLTLKYKENSSSSDPIIVYNDSSVTICGAALLAKKYLCVYYSPSNENKYYAKVFKYDANSSNPYNTPIEETYSFEHIEGVALAESPTRKCYVAILYYDANTPTTVKIYEVGENEECAAYTLPNSSAIGILNFQALIDGSFYLEFVEDDASGYNSMKSVRLISKTNYEESNLLNRKSCFMDKYGFMYRLDTISNTIIKTASLDGEPLETHKIIREINEGGVFYEPLNGILGLKEDGSTLYVW